MVIKFAPFNESKPYDDPVRASHQAAGIDLYCSEVTYLHSLHPTPIHTNLAWQCPPTHFGLLRLRSRWAQAGILQLPSGIIDPDYRGEIVVWAVNLNDEAIAIDLHERVAQLVVLPRPTFDISLASYAQLSHTERGQGGFGSTGRF
jgi:dUTP pyrophosphatase